MNLLPVELVIGITLLVFFGGPPLVMKIIEVLSARRAALPPVSAKEGAVSAHTCPYCKDAIAPEAVHIECAKCATWHHATCFEEHQGCAVFGCSEKRGVGRATRTS